MAEGEAELPSLCRCRAPKSSKAQNVANVAFVCHKAAFVARLNKGCRGGDHADILAFCEIVSDINALTSICRSDARLRACLRAGFRRAKCPS